MPKSTPPGGPSLFDSGPSLDTVLATIADVEALEATAAKLGVTRARLVRILKSAITPAPETPAVADTPKTADAAHPSDRRATHKKVRVFFDGASRGNPGPAGAGAVVFAPDGTRLAEAGKYLGVQTNNVAEYQGALLALETALSLGATEVEVRADSMLAIMQMRGEWKVKNEGLRPLHEKARALLAKFTKTDLQHVPRERNGAADEMSNRAIDEKM